MLHSVDEHLEHLDAIAPNVERMIPEIGADLAACARILRTVSRLGLRGDRRLLGIDVTNLRTTLDRILALREEGVDTPHLNDAARDLSVLVRDMRRRSGLLIAAESQDIALHTSIAKHRTSDEPFDVTHNLRMVTAAPAPEGDQSPGVLVAVQPLAAPNTAGAYGRIAGHIFAYALPNTLNAAPRDSAIVPAGSVVHFSHQDTFLVHTQGWTQAGRFTSPDKEDEVTTTLVEAGDKGATVYGPAVITCAPQDTGILSQAQSLKKHLNAIHYIMPEHHWLLQIPLAIICGVTSMLFSALICGFLSIALKSTGVLTTESLNNPVVTNLVLGVPFLGVTAALVCARWYAHKETRALQANPPAAATDTTLSGRIRSFFQRHTTTHAYESYIPVSSFLPYRGRKKLPTLDAALARRIEDGDGFNIQMPDFVEALHEDDVQVMRPLLALPAPSPVDDVVVPMRAAFSKA